ncbi:extracellular solute-binding protein [Vagococcus fessus]|uniref:ABC transporter substrate-binding protein n=1 Tax=Vagococcus fessus TaxID=120370 RepID=A0A430A5D9_9ENTE|nr:extracellular solute-binding protein [Vagococcus fessus]RSU01984.1 hypothetical protein CBF31_09480 [Vagococcus fessus]
MKSKNKLVLGALICTGFLLTACGGGKDVSKGNESEYKPYGKYDDTVTFTMGKNQRDVSTLPKGQTQEDNFASQYLLEEGNIKMKIDWEAANFTQKVSLATSTGEIPDVMIVGEDQFKELADNGLLQDLSKAYEKAASDDIKERMDSYDFDALEYGKVDDQLLGIPAPYYYYEQTLTWIRKDWLDKVDAKLPTNLDELYDLAKLFVEKDLAGNGKTVGILPNDKVAGVFGESYDLAPIFNQYNSYPRQWIEKDGKVEYGSIQPETKDVLGKLSELYKDGVIDKQFAVRTLEERQGLVADSLGIQFAPFWTTLTDMKETIKSNPEADWIPCAIPLKTGEKTQSFYAKPIINYLVVRKDYEHPEAIMRAMNLSYDFRWSNTEEARKFRDDKLGKGVDWPWGFVPVELDVRFAKNNQDDSRAVAKALETGKTKDLSPRMIPTYEAGKKYLEKGTADPDSWGTYKQYVEGLGISSNEEINEYHHMAFYGKTKGMKTKWANLEKIEDETFLKIITGEKSLDEFDKFVKQWKSIGGTDITEEVNKEVSK